MEDLMVTIM
jgi:dynein heavy chain